MAYREVYISREEFSVKYYRKEFYDGFVEGAGYAYFRTKHIVPNSINGIFPKAHTPSNQSFSHVEYTQYLDTSPEDIRLSLRRLYPNGHTTYVVKPHDNPSKIAANFGTTADILMRANGITDPTKLQIGKILLVPTSAKRELPQTTPANSNFPTASYTPRDMGEIKAYEPNGFGKIEEFLNRPSPYAMMPIQVGADIGGRFIGRIVYSTVDDVLIMAQSFFLTNPIHLNGSYATQQEKLNSGINGLLTIAPIGRISKLSQSGKGVLNAAQFNVLNKGTGINAAKEGGLLIRHYNYIERNAAETITHNKNYLRGVSVLDLIYNENFKDE